MSNNQLNVLGLFRGNDEGVALVHSISKGDVLETLLWSLIYKDLGNELGKLRPEG